MQCGRRTVWRPKAVSCHSMKRLQRSANEWSSGAPTVLLFREKKAEVARPDQSEQARKLSETQVSCPRREVAR